MTITMQVLTKRSRSMFKQQINANAYIMQKKYIWSEMYHASG